MRIWLALWLVVATVLEGLAAFALLFALAMSPMAFASKDLYMNPGFWMVLGLMLFALVALVALIVIQWILFFVKKDKMALRTSLVPIVAMVLLTFQPVQNMVFGLMERFDQKSQTEAKSGILLFQVVAPGLSQDSTLFLAGSPQDWGPWKPDGRRFEYRGNDTWECRAVLDFQDLEYKLTLGNWQHEALDENGFKRSNAVLEFKRDTLIVDTVRAWSDGNSSPPIVGQITGQLDTLGLKSGAGLLPRDVWVWVPPETPSGAPIARILVMHDGQNVVDPATSSFGVDWGVDECLDSLVRQERVPRTLLVAVACTEERGQDYGPGAQGTRYVDWLMEDLLPDIRRDYGVSESARVTVAGSSMGGLISFIAAERHPDKLSSVICMSPAFAYKRFSYPDSLRARGWPGNRVAMWLDNGDVGLENDLWPGIEDMNGLLVEVGQPFKLVNVGSGRHFESDWGARFDMAYLWALANEDQSDAQDE